MLKKVTKLLFLIFLLTTSFAWASNSVQKDDSLSETTASEATVSYDRSDTITVRSFNAADIEKFQQDSDFAYYQQNEKDVTWWMKFKMWLYDILESLLSDSKTPLNKFFNILLYVFVAATIVYIILSMMGVKVSNLFYQNKNLPVMLSTNMEEDIHAINFETQLAEALNQKEYRKATRLLYLAALKILTDKKLIRWSPGKTNHEYMSEINSPELKPGLEELAYYFEYAWYGNFPLSESTFRHVQTTFESLKQKIQSEK